MKHIKYFESKREYKKYLIVYKPTESKWIFDYREQYDYYIVRFISKYTLNNDNRILVDFLFCYNNENDFKTVNIHEIQLLVDRLNIIYQSDKLYECKKNLEMLSNAKKYNL